MMLVLMVLLKEKEKIMDVKAKIKQLANIESFVHFTFFLAKLPCTVTLAQDRNAQSKIIKYRIL